MKKIVLTYPKDFPTIEREAVIISQIGFLTTADLINNKLYISDLGDKPNLESVFDKDVIERLKKSGVEVEVE